MVLGKRKRTKTEKALQLLQKGAVAREDSDDELGNEDIPWRWIYEGDADNAKKKYASLLPIDNDGRRIVGAQMGSFQCKIGDAVLLKAAGSEAWVALITAFSEGEIEDDDGQISWSKKATFMWFSSKREIRKSARKRDDALPIELYITDNVDENSLATINGKANVLSFGEMQAKYPGGKIPRGSKALGKTFMCRRGCNLRTTSYTNEFDWNDVFAKTGDIDSLVDLVQSQTLRTRKERQTSKVVLESEHAVDEPTTPKKRRKSELPTTPKSRAEKQVRTPVKLLTPSNKRITEKKPLAFTPLGTRIIPDVLNTTPHQQARSTLHVSAVPTSLPCREEEFAEIYSHLESAISTATGSTIYISGTPGTGKTATVREVVAALNQAVEKQELDDFIFVEINGMQVTDPHQSYSLLWQALKDQRVSPSHALELLEREFNTPSPRRTPCVVLMDELDQLVTRNQGVMYNFFNWPQSRHSRLIVLAVANTMDLPERTLSNKISSRLGLTRIVFPGYTFQQLVQIIQSRLQTVKSVIVEKDAIEFASRKVAMVSGDARRALDICRRAVEIAETDHARSLQITSNISLNDDSENVDPNDLAKKPAQTGVVSILTIRKAIAEATSTPLTAYLRSMPLTTKMFLAAVLARMRRSGINDANVGDILDDARRIGAICQNTVVEKYLLVAQLSKNRWEKEKAWLDSIDKVTLENDSNMSTNDGEGEKMMRVVGLNTASTELCAAGVIWLENGRDRCGRVRLKVNEQEIRDALRDDEESKGLGFGI